MNYDIPVTFVVTKEAARRIAAEARRSGSTTGAVINHLAERLPAAPSERVPATVAELKAELKGADKRAGRIISPGRGLKWFV